MLFIWTEVVLSAGILNKNATHMNEKQWPVKVLMLAIRTLLSENVLQYLTNQSYL